MEFNEPPGGWNVDLAAKIATRGRVVIRFRPRGREGLDVAFIAGDDCSLEQQCLIAGEATVAIKSKLSRH